jgi:Rho-binding antiterminator
MSTHYIPISCTFHDRLEAIATMRRPVRIDYRTPAGDVQSIDAGITDLFATNREEYVLLATGEAVRLDRLVRVDDGKFDGNSFDLLR